MAEDKKPVSHFYFRGNASADTGRESDSKVHALYFDLSGFPISCKD